MRVVCFYFLILYGLVFLPPAYAQVVATGFHIEEQQGEGAFTLDLSGNPAYKVFLLPNPDRLVIDVKEGQWSVPSDIAYQPKDASSLVQGLRHGIQEGTDFRVVLDLSEKVVVTHTVLQAVDNADAYRLEVKIALSGEGKKLPEAAIEPPAPVKLPVIVLDPGHGGEDPGTIGRFMGKYEKDIALDYAFALRDALEKEGKYNIVLTRSGDYFIPLGERVEIARKARGDLFISLHANSHAEEMMSGLSVYTVSDTASDTEAELLAAKENTEDVLKEIHISEENSEVAPVLINLMQRGTKNISAGFAEGAIAELGQEVKLLRNTHRFAGFKVLKGIDVPAALFELGYLTNREEEQLLTSTTHQQKIIDAMVRAVNAHFEVKE